MKTYSIPTNKIFGATCVLRAGGYLHHTQPTSPFIGVYPESGPGYHYVPVSELEVGDVFRDSREAWRITEISPEVVEDIALHVLDEDKTFSGLHKTGEKGKQSAQYISFTKALEP